ncbi:MAG: hypothetical protein IPL50_12025 [Chitinophagaceae bacterium]|nr:hypothetical protein [Chitinophagaceae bacterium]
MKKCRLDDGRHFFFNRIGIGRFVNRFIPICDIKGTLPGGLSKQETREWCILDTFDMFSPEYDQPQKISTVKKWFEENSMEQVWGGKYTTIIVWLML